MGKTGAWRIEIDMKDTANVNLIERCFSNPSGNGAENGTLVLDNDRYLLCVKHPNFGPSRATHYINLTPDESVEVVEWPKRPVATFRKWSLAVHMGGDDPFQTLMSLPVETEE